MKIRSVLLSVVLLLGLLPGAFASEEISRFEIGAAPNALPQPPLTRGTYVSNDEKGMQIRVDESQRLTTNIQIIMTTTGARAPLVFPQRLRWDEVKSLYITRGSFTMQFLTTAGYYAQCTFPATFQGDLYNEGRALDVTIIIPQSFLFGPYGCQWNANQNLMFAFTRLNPEPPPPPPPVTPIPPPQPPPAR